MPLLFGCATNKSLVATQIAPGVFAGRKPHSDADFQALKAKGIRTVVNLQTMTWDIAPERKLAERNGIAFRNIPITASPFGPRAQKVQQLFQTLATPSLQPVYVHCLLGRDRTGVLMALYRVYYNNVDPNTAWAEMIRRGDFKSRWGLVGFKLYYWHHLDKPAWVAHPAAPESNDAPFVQTAPVDGTNKPIPKVHAPDRAGSRALVWIANPPPNSTPQTTPRTPASAP